MTKLPISFLFCLSLTLFLFSCEEEDLVNPELSFVYDFDSGTEGWIGEFADYPNDDGVEDFYQLAFAHANLPEPLNTNDGALRQSGSNRSDDLFMFVKRKLTGLEPNQEYTLDIAIEIATDAASGAVGIGGAPGESVFLKAGATSIEPMKVLDNTDNHFRMNIDKGNQSKDGRDMKNIGDYANGTADFIFTLKSLQTADPLSVTSNSDGEIWLILGTDSGFEGTTTIYYNWIKFDLERANN